MSFSIPQPFGMKNENKKYAFENNKTHE